MITWNLFVESWKEITLELSMEEHPLDHQSEVDLLRSKLPEVIQDHLIRKEAGKASRECWLEISGVRSGICDKIQTRSDFIHKIKSWAGGIKPKLVEERRSSIPGRGLYMLQFHEEYECAEALKHLAEAHHTHDLRRALQVHTWKDRFGKTGIFKFLEEYLRLWDDKNTLRADYWLVRPTKKVNQVGTQPG